MGLHQEPQFQKYHRVLSRNRWSSGKAAQILLGLLVRAFASTGAVIIGIDETLERRQGEMIAAKGIYRDAARSSRSVLVKSHGLRWISMMVLAPIPWAARVWALPFLSVLAPSERYAQERGRRHKTLAHWAGRLRPPSVAVMVTRVRRWLPERSVVLSTPRQRVNTMEACIALS
jgi:hypothetical protein